MIAAVHFQNITVNAHKRVRHVRKEGIVCARVGAGSGGDRNVTGLQSTSKTIFSLYDEKLYVLWYTMLYCGINECDDHQDPPGHETPTRSISENTRERVMTT